MSDWRLVSEPPDSLRRVVVTTRSGPFIGFYDAGHAGTGAGRGWWADDGHTPLPVVTHWIDLPAAPTPNPRGEQ